MKKLLIALMLSCPLAMNAQSEWETGQSAAEKLEQAKQALEAAKKAEKEAKEAAKQAEKAAKLKAKQAEKEAKDAQKAAKIQAEAAERQARANAISNQQKAVETPQEQDGWTVPVKQEPSKNEWAIPEKQPEVKPVKEVKPNERKEDPKYLDGAVPLVDGKVVFTLDVDVPHKNAQQIYDIIYNYLDEMVTGENQFPESKIALVNKREHVIAARYKEWLVFSSSFLSLDRTEFNYTIIATCTDGHLNLTLSRISYNYERDRPTGFNTNAEEWITDGYALNKKHTDVSRISGKFRKKTIDRKDEIFEQVKALLK